MSKKSKSTPPQVWGGNYPRFNQDPRALIGAGEYGRSGLTYFMPGWIQRDFLPELQGRRALAGLQADGLKRCLRRVSLQCQLPIYPPDFLARHKIANPETFLNAISLYHAIRKIPKDAFTAASKLSLRELRWKRSYSKRGY